MEKEKIIKFYFPIRDSEKNTFEGVFETRVDKINMNKKGDTVKLFIGPVEMEISEALWGQLIKG
jgi:hypothetical protein